MSSGSATRSHEQVVEVLRRAGYPDEFIREVLSELPDPLDLHRDQEILGRYGLSPEGLMDRLGAGP
jgi:hypothetical protein